MMCIGMRSSQGCGRGGGNNLCLSVGTCFYSFSADPLCVGDFSNYSPEKIRPGTATVAFREVAE